MTYHGYVYGMLAALRHMLPRDRGVIVNVGSALAYRSIPLQAAYCGAKHAMVGFTDSLRCELIHDRSRVRVSVVHLPGDEHAAVRPGALEARPQAAAGAADLPARGGGARDRASRRASTTRVLGGRADRRRDLGTRLIPGLLDHYLGRTGYRSQQTPEPADPDRPDNLWKPVPGDLGAHGRFDAVRTPGAGRHGPAAHRRALVAAGAAAAGALALARRDAR